MTELSLIFPLYIPEADFVGNVLTAVSQTLGRMKVSYECLLVKNGPKGTSLAKVEAFAAKNKNVKILTSTSSGYGSAIIKGLWEAKGEYVLFMPIDGQVDLGDLPKIWNLMRTNKWQLVKGKRVKRENWERLLISKILALLSQVIFSTSVEDVNGSPKIFPGKYVKLLKLKSSHSLIDLELIVKAQKLGWKIKELPTRTLAREGGKSTRGFSTYVEFIREMFNLKFSNFFQEWEKNAKRI